MKVVIDNCHFTTAIPGIEIYDGTNWARCGAEAGVVPATQACPANGTGMKPLWSAERAGTANTGRTMESGPVQTSVPQTVAYRVCLYGVHESAQYGEAIRLRAEALTPSPPGDDDPPVGSDPLTAKIAKAAARAALVSKFGRKFTRGKRVKLRCSKKGAGYRCPTSWKFRKSKYSGAVAITGDAENPTAKVNVRKQRR